MSTAVPEQALNRAFTDLADSLVSQFDLVDLLHQLVTRVTELLSADAASILLRDAQGDLQVVASPEATRTLEIDQLQCGQGPGLDCLRTGRAVSVPDLDAQSARWELFVPMARDCGLAAVHALPMRARQQVIGALSLYTVEVGELPEGDLHAAQALVDLATIGILQERASQDHELILQQTRGSVHGQFVIEQAKGMLAASGVSMEDAYDLLRHFARYRESRLLEVAADLTAGRIDPAVIIADGSLRPTAPSKAPPLDPTF
jgi:GAF domain-containing protein